MMGPQLGGSPATRDGRFRVVTGLLTSLYCARGTAATSVSEGPTTTDDLPAVPLLALRGKDP